MKKNETPVNQLSQDEPRWFAVNTGYKKEKVVQKNLIAKGVEVFLPINKVHRQWGRKKRVVELPLINCYIFVKITKKDYIPILQTPNVIRFLKIGKELEAIPENQIETLKRVIGENIAIEATTEYLQSGDAVEIVAGNLIGIKGRLIDIKGKNKFVIQLDRLGFNLLLELPANLIRPIKGQRLEYI